MRVPHVAAVLLLHALVSVPAFAAVNYLVNDATDTGDASPGDGICQTSTPAHCTLRAAIQEANVTGGVIGLPVITITLGSPLVVTKTMRIEGSGAAVSVISANLLDRAFSVQPPMGIPVTLTIRDTTLRDGSATSGDSGGAVLVYPDAVVVLERCRLVHNYAAFGGAILCDSGSSVTIKDSELTDDHVTSLGGALLAYNCSLDVSGSSIHDNTATQGGGGIDVIGGTVTLTNTTVAQNITDGSGGGIALGDSMAPSTVTLYSSTLSGNLAKNGTGGGIKILTNATATIQSSVLAFNWNGSPLMAESDCNGPLTSNAPNIVKWQGNCTVTGTATAADPLLGPLQNNGGRGPTFALTTSSPAINTGPVAGCTGPGNVSLATDQRGVARSLGGRCDLGAYERGPCGDVNGDGSVSVGDVFFLINALFAGGAPPPGLANVNGDSQVNVSDVFFLINQLFAGGSAPTCTGT